MEVVVAEIVKFYFSLSYSYYCSQIVDVVVEEDVAINIRKVASPHVQIASQSHRNIGNLTLLLRKNLAIFPMQ